jgi:hypothetical protein
MMRTSNSLAAFELAGTVTRCAPHPGCAVHEEMAMWQDAGIPPAEVLRSATLVPA